MIHKVSFIQSKVFMKEQNKNMLLSTVTKPAFFVDSSEVCGLVESVRFCCVHVVKVKPIPSQGENMSSYCQGSLPWWPVLILMELNKVQLLKHCKMLCTLQKYGGFSS
ncbi:unnamed protein product [Gadus morhua 'NCC']